MVKCNNQTRKLQQSN